MFDDIFLIFFILPVGILLFSVNIACTIHALYRFSVKISLHLILIIFVFIYDSLPIIIISLVNNNINDIHSTLVTFPLRLNLLRIYPLQSINLLSMAHLLLLLKHLSTSFLPLFFNLLQFLMELYHGGYSLPNKVRWALLWLFIVASKWAFVVLHHHLVGFCVVPLKSLILFNTHTFRLILTFPQIPSNPVNTNFPFLSLFHYNLFLILLLRCICQQRHLLYDLRIHF